MEGTCGQCGERFAPTRRQRDNIRAGKTVYCSKPCLYLSRGVHSRARWESGHMPKWGSPAQVMARDRLVAHNRSNKLTGPAHPRWKGGEHSQEAKAKDELDAFQKVANWDESNNLGRP